MVKKIIKELKPFWDEYEKALSAYYRKIVKIEEAMNKSRKLPLEFFYVDGECVGIGASNYDDRGKFKLIHASEFPEQNE